MSACRAYDKYSAENYMSRVLALYDKNPFLLSVLYSNCLWNSSILNGKNKRGFIISLLMPDLTIPHSCNCMTFLLLTLNNPLISLVFLFLWMASVSTDFDLPQTYLMREFVALLSLLTLLHVLVRGLAMILQCKST